MEWLAEVKPLLELAFREGGKGLLWTSLGGVAGLILSLILIFSLSASASRISWPTKGKWGKWCRIILLTYALLTVPLTAVTAGVGWGLVTSLINVINHEQWIQKASEEGLNELVAVIYVQLDAKIENRELGEEEEENMFSRYASGEEVISIASLEHKKAVIRNGLVKEIAEKAINNFEMNDGNLVSRLGALIARHVWSWLAEAKVDILMQYVDRVIDQLKADEKKDTVDTREISFAIGEVLVKPHIDKKMRSYQSNMITLGVIQVGVLLVPPIGIVWIVSFIFRRIEASKLV